MAEGGGFKNWFKEKVWPLIKLIPLAILTGLLLGGFYCLFVSAECKLYIYLIGTTLAFFGFYVTLIFSRIIKRTEFDPEEEQAELEEG